MRSPYSRSGLAAISLVAGIAPGFTQASGRVPENCQAVPTSLTVTLDDTDTEPQSLELRLPACFSCGYSWALVDSTSIHMESRTESAAPGMVEIKRLNSADRAIGGSEVQVMEFERLAKGHYDLKLVYRRPFGNAPAAKTVALSIDVR